MLVIAYHSNIGYKFMSDRLKGIVEQWGISFMDYDRIWLENTKFYGYHKHLLDQPRGNGYWAWKPYIMLDAINKSDTVIYLDSSVVPQSKEAIMEIVEATKDVGSIETEFINREWTKRECFRNMNCDEEKYWNANQVWAGVVVAKRSGREILSEWFCHCSGFFTVSDTPSEDNFEGFKEHRHDQSILTNILIKYGQPMLHSAKFKDCVKYG